MGWVADILLAITKPFIKNPFEELEMRIKTCEETINKLQEEIGNLKEEKILPPFKRQDLFCQGNLLYLKTNDKEPYCKWCYDDGDMILLKKREIDIYIPGNLPEVFYECPLCGIEIKP